VFVGRLLLLGGVHAEQKRGKFPTLGFAFTHCAGSTIHIARADEKEFSLSSDGSQTETKQVDVETQNARVLCHKVSKTNHFVYFFAHNYLAKMLDSTRD